MKIAVITHKFPTISETFILNQVTGLIDRGHDVDVFGIRPGTDSSLQADVVDYRLLDRTYYLSAPKNKFHRVNKAVKLFGSKFGKNPKLVLSSLNPIIYGRRAINLNMLFMIAPFADDYDIIHCHFGNVANFLLPVLRAGLHTKIVTTFHGFDTRLGGASNGNIYKELFEYGDCFIAVTEYNYQHLVQFGLGRNKIVYHPLGINIGNFHPPDSAYRAQTDCLRIITVARLVKEKGLQYGIRAVRSLLDKLPDIKIEYHIIGDGPLRKQLELTIAELGLSDHVFLRGGMTQGQINDELDRCHIFLLPSIEESFGIVLLEAQAKQLPVVVSKVGSTSQAVQDGISAFLVPPGDVETLTDRLAILTTDRQKRFTMGEAGRRYVENNFDNNTLNDRLVKIYERILGRS